ncbi:MAG TPA: FKBP-type peptidyl-prolyl cis-trans isomerase [Chthoniobacter sp.]|jgi:FKBP-type peptidyl-prolyl cis-trans isomerase
MKPSILRSLCCTVLGAAFLLAPLTTMADSALEKGQKFLRENAMKDGVKATKSGLQYKIIKEGTGKRPAATDTVLVHYRGTLLDGTEFDSSYKRNQPISFPLNHVIPGWTEGLQLLKEGGKAILYIPSDLAYGENGTPGGPIGPNETLIFEVELLKVE